MTASVLPPVDRETLERALGPDIVELIGDMADIERRLADVGRMAGQYDFLDPSSASADARSAIYDQAHLFASADIIESQIGGQILALWKACQDDYD